MVFLGTFFKGFVQRVFLVVLSRPGPRFFRVFFLTVPFWELAGRVFRVFEVTFF